MLMACRSMVVRIVYMENTIFTLKTRPNLRKLKPGKTKNIGALSQVIG